jgi:hypothetical protein
VAAVSLSRVYFAHPVGDDVLGNLENGAVWLEWLMLREPDVCFVAPWFAYAHAFLAGIGRLPRARIMRDNVELARTCDGGIVLCGQTVSDGMRDEMRAAPGPVADLVGIGRLPPDDVSLARVLADAGATGVLGWGLRRGASLYPVRAADR